MKLERLLKHYERRQKQPFDIVLPSKSDCKYIKFCEGTFTLRVDVIGLYQDFIHPKNTTFFDNKRTIKEIDILADKIEDYANESATHGFATEIFFREINENCIKIAKDSIVEIESYRKEESNRLKMLNKRIYI